MLSYSKHMTGGTPQTEKVKGVKRQVRNDAGGVSFKMNKWDFMQRFLVLGTEGGSFYATERKLSMENIDNVLDCIKKDGKRAVDMAVTISHEGRSAKNDAAIFVLVLAIAHGNKDVKHHAYVRMPEICRIGTHLFTFMAYAKDMPEIGYGSGMRKAIARWYLNRDIDQLAYQLMKYQQREGWSHRDVLRLSHVKPKEEAQGALFKYVVGKSDFVPEISDFTIGINKITKGMDVAKAVRQYGLVREVLPTESLNRVDVWEALLEKMPITALIRNLGKMASLGMHQSLSTSVKLTTAKLIDEVALRKGRVHPLSVLNAWRTYSSGHGVKGKLSWGCSPAVIEALEDAFYKSFKQIEPTGKNIMLALDVSGSMTMYSLSGTNINCREASGVMAMATMRSEKNYMVVGFTSSGSGYSRTNTALTELNLRSNMDFETVIHKISGLQFGGTDCALPMVYAKQHGIDLDVIVIYTDNETWAGLIHPWEALDQYQEKVGHEVKVVVVGMVSNNFSIARPDYSNMLDVVGFDTNTPAAISEYIRG